MYVCECVCMCMCVNCWNRIGYLDHKRSNMVYLDFHLKAMGNLEMS